MILYQLDSKGSVKTWSIWTEPGKNGAIDIVIESGLMDGRKTRNVISVTEGKNIGRANETTPQTQAISEMNSRIEEKLRSGYTQTLLEAKSSSVLGSGIPAPMLAQKYCKDGSQHGSKTLKQLKLEGKHIIVQPKLDGNRCIIKITGGIPEMYTRNGDLMPVQLDNILYDVERIAKEDAILDGELFSNEISFNTLNGLIKRVKATPEEAEKRKLIKYHIYDVMSNDGYEKRAEYIKQFATENIIVVPSTKIVATEENIQKHLEKFLEEGHEGLMIRQLGLAYDSKRSWQLCKVKVFEDEEFKLIGYLPDVRGDFVGSFCMEDKNGKHFNAGASGQSVEERAYMWNHPEEFVGKMATVEFFGRSEYGIPRFPKFKAIRETK